jgi:NADPH-dependent 2,4-dienoyl-CoA reductase/sulfur reductase-like enzyme
MMPEQSLRLRPVDVAVVGGGPAGLSACLELAGSSSLTVSLFEAADELGGIPRSCRLFFGMRDLKRIHTGKGYADLLNCRLRATSVAVHTDTTVLGIEPDAGEGFHRLRIVSPKGCRTVESRAILLATGCFERPRENRCLPGTRPAGIQTTGSLQEMVRLQGVLPGKRALVVGSEYIALSCVLTLLKAGVAIGALIVNDAGTGLPKLLARGLGTLYRFPVLKNQRITSVLGRRRVEGLELADRVSGESRRVDGDLLVVTGEFRPYTILIDPTTIRQDPVTLSPIIDEQMMTSVPNIFAAGNLVGQARMHDLCALEGRRVAKHIRQALKG